MTDPDTNRDQALLALLEVLDGILNDYEGTIDQIIQSGSAETTLGQFRRIKTARKIIDRVQEEFPKAA
jgi:ABC-type transport system involved in cytochrome bd biosynthesis fused ATPase/permease subunit